MGRKPVDLVGKRFGKLLVVEQTNQRKHNQVVWKCQCDCGNISYATNGALQSGSVRSCGCLYDLTGKRFGRLTVTEKAGKDKHGSILWRCKCDCGNITIGSQNILTRGQKVSCGCATKLCNNKDLTNQKFGRLLALNPTDKRKHGGVVWFCKCDCGNFTEVKSSSLICGETKSCGCLYLEMPKSKKHGMNETRIYKIFTAMHQRCSNPNNPEYHNYGGRGIRVCNEWTGESGFVNFYDWALKNGYDCTLTIDRVNNDGNYEPSNCKWSTFIRQQNNKRTNHNLTYLGKTQSIADWAREVGLEYNTLRARICKYGWSVEGALTIPVDESRSRR